MGVGLGQLRHGHGAVNHGLDLALPVPLGQLGHHGCVGLGLALGEFAPEHPHDRCALEQREVEGQRWNRARCETHHQVPPPPCDGAEGRFGKVAPDGVVDHIRPLAIRQGLDGLAQVFLAVVDGGIRTDGGAQRALFIAGSRGNHAGAQGLGDLDGGRAHPPRQRPAPARFRRP